MALTPYDRQYGFGSYQAGHPSDPLPGEQVDSEFDAIKASLDETQSALGLIQRDDGALGNATVGRDQLKPELATGLVAAAVKWSAHGVFPKDASVFYGTVLYRCLTAHVASTTFDSAKFTPLVDLGSLVFSPGSVGHEALADGAVGSNNMQANSVPVGALEAIAGPGLLGRPSASTGAVARLALDAEDFVFDGSTLRLAEGAAAANLGYTPLTAVPSFRTANYAPSLPSVHVEEHGLGGVPLAIMVYLENVTAEGGYAPGDIVLPISGAHNCVSVTADATNVYTLIDSGMPELLSRSTGVAFTPSASKWAIFSVVDGPSGVRGTKGAPGETGAVGEQGPVGDVGSKGETGDKGATGDKGPTGDRGLTGLTGDKGATGDKGPTGDKGATGDKGPTGDQGAVGPTGSGATVGFNRLLNGDFRINQRTYVSGATLAAGAYGHDRWKAGAGGGNYTFTQNASDTTITIASGKTLMQVVHGANVEGGAYTLSWTGTSQARVAVNNGTPSGAYATSPFAIASSTAGQKITVEFNNGTLGKVQLEPGTTATAFERVDYGAMLARCRWYGRLIGSANGYFMGLCINATQADCRWTMEPMQATPIISFSGAPGDYSVVAASGAPIACTAVNGYASKDSIEILVNVTGGLVAGNATMFFPTSTATIFLAAEL
jgi:Collagen triple helix repeat (20 copies)